jgi:hypothetical protein
MYFFYAFYPSKTSISERGDYSFEIQLPNRLLQLCECLDRLFFVAQRDRVARPFTAFLAFAHLMLFGAFPSFSFQVRSTLWQIEAEL